MVEDPNHSDKKLAVLELIGSTFDGNAKEAIKRKKGKKGPLYNRRGNNKYAFVVTVEKLYMFLSSVMCFWHASDLKPSDDKQLEE